MITRLLNAASRKILRKAIKKLKAEGWRPIGKSYPYLIFEGMKFDRVVFQQSIARHK